jgi:hypothetical protein
MQKVNDKCACGSGNKYKKCCMNRRPPLDKPIVVDYPKANTNGNANNMESLHTHTYLPPKTNIQSIIRNELEKSMAAIKEPHCKVCGDTAKDGKLFEIPTQIGDIYLCEECYNIQMKM